jgi:curved DNA-binding protein CbpA
MPSDSARINRRSHPRIHAPKGMIVAWRSGSQQGVSRMGTMALGGLFLHTPTPPSNGSMLELLFDIAMGAEVRARAVVRNSMPGKGMGVKFVHMRAEDRSRLNQFLKAQLEAGNIQEDFPPAQAKATTAEAVPTARITDPGPGTVEGAAEESTAAAPTPTTGLTPGPGPTVTSDDQLRQEAQAARTDKPAHDDGFASEDELKRYLALCEKGNYYQLLGVTADSAKGEIKQGFYALARKFHPDRHMGKTEWVGPLQQLMGAITEAYNVLSDDKKRGAYEKKQALSRSRTEAEESIDDCLQLAAGCQRDDNIAGAIFWLRKCVNLAPEVAKHRVSLAASLAAVTHHRREAAEQFQKAIELDQWNTGAYLQFGELYEAMQLPWRAKPLYSKVLEIDPEHALARQRLARNDGQEKKKSAPRMARIFSKKS